MAVPQKLNIGSPHEPAIPLLGTYTKELKAECQFKEGGPAPSLIFFWWDDTYVHVHLFLQNGL